MKPDDPLYSATNGLLSALDKAPRNDWAQVVLMALTAVRAVGYAEGFRVGAMKVDIPAAPALSATAGPMVIEPKGEDRALANDKPTAEEELEDLGFAFIKEFARQIGSLAKLYDVTPGGADVVPLEFFEGEINGVPRHFAGLNFRLRNITPTKGT